MEEKKDSTSEVKKEEGEGEQPKHIEIDYDAELKKIQEEKEKEQAARVKAEKALKEYRLGDEHYDEKRKLGKEEDDDKPLTKKDLESILVRERQAMEKTVQEAEDRRLARHLASSDAEAELTLEINKGMTFPSHFTQQDRIEAAHVIANRKKILGERDEALRRAQGNPNPAGTHHDAPSSPLTMASDMKAVMKERGFVATNGRFEKKLPSGKILISDPKGNIRLA